MNLDESDGARVQFLSTSKDNLEIFEIDDIVIMIDEGLDHGKEGSGSW